MSNLSITVIQTNLYWEDRAANLEMLEKKIMSAGEPTEIVVLPEMFTTGFSMQPENLFETMDGPSVQWMKKIAARKKIILTGSLIISESKPAPNGLPVYYNRLLWVLPNGELGYYDKRHCFAFAGENDHYTPGTKRLIGSAKGWKINLLICYDLRFPVWSRQASAPPKSKTGKNPGADAAEYDVVIYVANWPESRIGAWKTLLQARAIENQSYVVGVNRVGFDGNKIYHSGESMIVGPLGEILYHKKDEEDIFTTALDRTHLEAVRKKFPFKRDADRFSLLTDEAGF